MSTYAFMRLLESVPRRYDLGLRLLTFGGLEKAYDRLVNHVERGQRVLDIGCGTGALALRAARRGAQVKGIDTSAPMLEIAGKRAREAGLSDSVVLAEMGVAELDGEATHRYDVVMSGLCLSELSEDELSYTLRQVARVLRPDGILLIADEIEPRNRVMRLIQRLMGVPLAVVVHAITQQTTHPVSRLPERLIDLGFSIVSIRRSATGTFGEFVARMPVSMAA